MTSVDTNSYRAKINGFRFVPPFHAFNMAVQCVVLSYGRGLDLDKLYKGEISVFYFNWVVANCNKLSAQDAMQELSFVTSRDEFRMYARDAEREHGDFFMEDVAPLGRALEKILFEGATKKAALEFSSKYGSDLRREVDPKLEKKWPKQFLDVSTKTLERKWKDYQLVLPYVLFLYMQNRALHYKRSMLQMDDLELIRTQLLKKLVEDAKTNKSRIRSWFDLTFE